MEESEVQQFMIISNRDGTGDGLEVDVDTHSAGLDEDENGGDDGAIGFEADHDVTAADDYEEVKFDSYCFLYRFCDYESQRIILSCFIICKNYKLFCSKH